MAVRSGRILELFHKTPITPQFYTTPAQILPLAQDSHGLRNAAEYPIGVKPLIMGHPGVQCDVSD